MARRWTDDVFERSAALLSPYVPSGGVLADLGGGTGELGAGLARALDARAIIVDPTPQMLARVDPHPWVSVRLAPAESLPFPDDYFDALVCSDAFHHFNDQDVAAREIARVVRPGGGVLVFDFDPKGPDRFWAGLERLLREPAGFRTPDGIRRLFSLHGIDGQAIPTRRSSYRFLGTVETSSPPEAALASPATGAGTT